MLFTYREHFPACLPHLLFRAWETGRFAADAEDGTLPDLPTLQVSAVTIDPDAMLFEQPAHTVGRLLATIQNCATATTIFLYQCPPTEDVNPFLNQMHADMSEWYPDTNVEPLILGEILSHVAACLKDQSELPGWEILRCGVCPYATQQRMEIAYNQTWIITSTFLGGLIKSFLPLFKQRWSFAQFEDFVRGFVQTVRMEPNSQFIAPKMMYTTAQQPVDFNDYLADEDEAEVEYTLTDEMNKPTGPRIPMYVFCQLTLPVEPGTKCTVCLYDIDNAFTDAETEPVVTVPCGHYFHAQCLDNWVNESAMQSSGTCPECRTVLCESRSRAPASAVVEEDDYIMIWE